MDSGGEYTHIPDIPPYLWYIAPNRLKAEYWALEDIWYTNIRKYCYLTMEELFSLEPLTECPICYHIKSRTSPYCAKHSKLYFSNWRKKWFFSRLKKYF